MGFDLLHLRLNNRDTLRARRSNDNRNDFYISSSFRQNVDKSRPGQTAISFAAVPHQTVTADFAESTNDSDNEPGLDKSVRVLHLRCSGTEIIVFTEGIIIASVHDLSGGLQSARGEAIVHN
jgi:hypothetical protein